MLAAVIFTYRAALGIYRREDDIDPKPEKKGWRAWIPQAVLGAALFGMALNFQIKANHIQISYYLAIVIFCYAIGLFIWLVADKERRHGLGKFFAAVSRTRRNRCQCQQTHPDVPILAPDNAWRFGTGFGADVGQCREVQRP